MRLPLHTRNCANPLHCSFVFAYILAGVAVTSLLIPFAPRVQSEQTDPSTAPELVLQTGHAKGANALAFTADGRLLASGASDNTVKLWDLATKREVRTLTGHTGPVKAIAFRSDGRQLASSGVDGQVKIWDVVSGQEITTIKNNGSVTSMAFGPDGQMLAVGNMQKEVKLLSLSTNQATQTITGHTGFITALAFRPDGRSLVSGSADKTAKVWDSLTGKEIKTLGGHTERITSLTFSSDQQWLATGSFDRTVKLFRVRDWNEVTIGMNATSPILAVTFSPDSRTLICADTKRTIHTKDLSPGGNTQVRSPAGEEVTDSIAITFSADARWFASSSGDKAIDLLDVDTVRDLNILSTHSYAIAATAFSSGGHWFATGGNENTAKLWEVASGRELYTLDNRAVVNAVAFSPNESLLASASLSGVITIWETAGGRKQKELKGHTGSVNSLAFSPDGQSLASAGNDGAVKIWNVDSGAEKPVSGKHTAEVMAVAFSPDGKWIVSASADKTLKIWDSTTGSEQRTLKGHAGEILAVVVSSDGQLIASGGTDKQIKLWTPSSTDPIRTLVGHTGEVKALAFNKNGLLASGGGDNQIKFWNVNNGTPSATLTGHSSEINSLSFSSDGHWLISGSEDASSRLWDAGTGAAAATIISLRENLAGFAFDQTDWLVVSPDGLFDGSPGAWRQILWRFDRDSYNTRPVEVFFNDFFYPGLLADILTNKKPKAPRDIARIDRRQPTVTLSVPDQEAIGTVTARNVNVRIAVAEAPPDGSHTSGSGARDVRLFRNGSLVKVWRGEALSGNNPKNVFETEIPVMAGSNQLTAYAFNNNNIKSPDATLSITGAETLKRAGTAYIIAFGLNNYSNAGFNLKFAVPDAIDFSGEVQRNELNLLGRFAEVQLATLIDKDATKANILAALRRLSKDGGSSQPAEPGALSVLKPSEPEDAVVIYFAGHGLALDQRFYMLPYDLGFTGNRKRLDLSGYQLIAEHSVSDRELEYAFERVNAAQIIFVIDACYSGQALESEEKRRGPMNSKGLAQLAYEKGIYVLAAAQSYQAANEATELGHGLLTYALIEEGLKRAFADRSPKDGRVLLQEWLDYATERVPQLQMEKMRQARSAGSELAFIEGEEQTELLKRSLQRPRAFYRCDLPVPIIAISREITR